MVSNLTNVMEDYKDLYEGLRNKVVAITDLTLPFSQLVAQKLVEHRVQLVLGTTNAHNEFVAEMEGQFKPNVLPVYYAKESPIEVNRFFRQTEKYFDRPPAIVLYEFNVPQIPASRENDKEVYAFEHTVKPYLRIAETASEHIRESGIQDGRVIIITPQADPRVLSLDEELMLASSLKTRELLQRRFGEVGINFLNFIRGYQSPEGQVDDLILNYMINGKL